MRPIAPHQQVRVVPSTANDFSIGVHLAHQVLRVHLGVDVVPADEEVGVVREAPLSENRVSSQADGPPIRVPFIHCAIAKAAAETFVVEVVDAVAVLVEDHI